MTPPTPCPAAVFSLTGFGAALARAAADGIPAPHPHALQFVPPGPDPAAQVLPVLTAVLSAPPSPAGRFLTDGVPYKAPLVVLLAAAAELPGVRSVSRVVEAVRAEYKRSNSNGRVVLVVYAGPVGGRVPSDATLRALAAYTAPDTTLVFTDTDGRNRRLYEEQAVATGALFVEHLLQSEELQTRVARCGRGTHAAFGLGRVDVTDASVRACLLDHFRGRVRAALFASATVGPGPALDGLDAEALAAEGRRAGTFRAQEARAVSAARERAWLCAAARQRESEDATRRALAELLPRPAGAARRSWWRRLWAWIRRVIFRRPDPLPTPDVPRTVATDSDAVAARLAHADRVRVLIGWLDQALAASPEPSRAAVPYALALADVCGIRERAIQRYGQIDPDELSRHLAREFPLAEVADDDRLPLAFASRVDALCARLLRLDERRLVVTADDFRELAATITPLVAPLFCGRGSEPVRVACVPPALRAAFPTAGSDVISGREGEVLFFVLQPDVSFLSLLSEEGNTDGRAGTAEDPLGPAGCGAAHGVAPCGDAGP